MSNLREYLLDKEQQYEAYIQQDLWELFLFLPARKFMWLLGSVLFFMGLALYVFTQSIMITVCALILASASPPILIRRYKTIRTEKLISQLPDASMMLSNTLSSGGSLISGFNFVYRNSDSPLSQELSVVMRKVRLGHKLSDALMDMRNKLSHQQLNKWVDLLVIVSASGGQQSVILERMAESMRSHHRLSQRVKSLSAQGNMQGKIMSLIPLLLCGALYLIERESMRSLMSKPVGWVLAILLISLILIGQFWINKLLNVRVPL